MNDEWADDLPSEYESGEEMDRLRAQVDDLIDFKAKALVHMALGADLINIAYRDTDDIATAWKDKTRAMIRDTFHQD